MPAPSTSNIINMADFDRFKTELDRIDRDEADEKARQKGAMLAISDRRKRVFKAMKGAGLPVHEIKIALKQAKLARKIMDLQEEIDEGQRPVAEVITERLGCFADLPLGVAAIEAAQKRHAADAAHNPNSNAAAVDSLTDEDWDAPGDDEDEDGESFGDEVADDVPPRVEGIEHLRGLKELAH